MESTYTEVYWVTHGRVSLGSGLIVPYALVLIVYVFLFGDIPGLTLTLSEVYLYWSVPVPEDGLCLDIYLFVFVFLGECDLPILEYT